MSGTVVLQSFILIILRLILFAAWRKYLSRTLYPDLASLSLETSLNGTQTRNARADSVDGAVELSALPPPITTPVEGSSSHRRSAKNQKLLHSSISRAIFSLVITESCIVFLLLVLQAVDVFSPSTRLYNWRYSLTFLIFSILVLIPQCMSLLLMVGVQSNDGRRRFFGIRIVISFIPVLVFLFALANIPLPAGLTSRDALTNAISRLIILGTIVLGVLSGFGAVSNAWGFLPFLSASRPVPTDQQISSTEYSLAAIRNDLQDRRTIAARNGDSSADKSWLSRVGATLRPNTELEQEIRGLEALEYETARKLELLRESRDAAKFNSTWKGRTLNAVGYLFAIYCVVRFFNSLANIVLPSRRLASSSRNYPDIISELLVYILSLVYTSRYIELEDVTPIARQLSLGFVGIMILTSIRLVLRGVTRALRVTSRNLGASLMLLILAQLMGIYLLSTVVQMRSSFPPPPKPPGDEDVVNLFSTIPPYEVFGSLFDWSFLIVAITSAAVRWGAQKMNNVGDL
ncbi:G protein-coupled receptor 89 [Amanita rubescens]|nr:G protein-coupled receptor 89 [Amanita rubescens]